MCNLQMVQFYSQDRLIAGEVHHASQPLVPVKTGDPASDVVWLATGESSVSETALK